jgi:molecular chaperone DnaJ
LAAVRRDYYEVLGVPRDADEATIKRAFRRLARELHPDVSGTDDGGEQFKEVVEAYEVLSSSERRLIYDRYGHEGLKGGGFVPTTFDLGSLSDLFAAFFGDDLLGPRMRRSRRGADIVAEVSIDLVEAARGTTQSVPFQVAVACGTCGGSGAAPGTTPVVCSRCRGAGRVQHVTRSSFAEFVRTETCDRCGGVGTVVESPCESCGGRGSKLEERSLDVPIPPGIHDGQRIRLSGEGHAGEVGGQAGDVYVLVHVRPDPRFVREGNDIFSAADVSIAEAALGTTIAVATLDGDLDVPLEPGTQPGDVLTLPGLGMPVLQGNGRGDHRVLVNVKVPRRLDDEQRQALEQFAALEDERAYEDDSGLFGRLRSRFR